MKISYTRIFAKLDYV